MSISSLFSSKFKHFFAALLIAIGVMISYANVVNAPFIWDDEEMVVGNPLIQNLDQAKTIFSAGPFKEKWENIKFYRPIQTLSYALDYRIWKLNPTGYHLSSITIHTLSSLALYILLLSLGLTPLLACISAGIWAIHPLHIESVTYISGRGDALFLLFSILSLIFWIKAIKEKAVYYLPAILMWGIAILSKENALPVPLIAASYAWFYHRDTHPKAWKWNSLLALGLVAFTTWIRLFLMGASKSDTLSWIAYSSLKERLLTLPYICFTYIKLWFIPHPLHMEYHYIAEKWTDPYIWFGIPVLILVASLLYKYTPRKAFGFYVSWIVLGLIPVYNVMLPLASTLREHWFYLSGVGLSVLCCMATKELINRYAISTKTVQLGLATLVILLIGITITRNQDWTDPLTLYEHDLKYEPKSFLLHNNVGVEYFRKKEFSKAKEAFRNAIENSPSGGYGIAHNNYGVILENEGKLPEAVKQFELSIGLSQYNLAYMNLGRIFIQNKYFPQAVSILKEGVKNNPYSPQLWYLLGVAAYNSQDIALAKEAFTKLDQLSPNFGNVKQILNTLPKG